MLSNMKNDDSLEWPKIIQAEKRLAIKRSAET